MTATVLSEFRRSSKSAVIEKLHDDYKTRYRVIVAKRYPTLDEAKEAFLSEVAESRKEACEEEIKNQTR